MTVYSRKIVFFTAPITHFYDLLHSFSNFVVLCDMSHSSMIIALAGSLVVGLLRGGVNSPHTPHRVNWWRDRRLRTTMMSLTLTVQFFRCRITSTKTNIFFYYVSNYTTTTPPVSNPPNPIFFYFLLHFRTLTPFLPPSYNECNEFIFFEKHTKTTANSHPQLLQWMKKEVTKWKAALAHYHQTTILPPPPQKYIQAQSTLYIFRVTYFLQKKSNLQNKIVQYSFLFLKFKSV